MERSPNRGSFSLPERREAVRIRNQEMCDLAISIIDDFIKENLSEVDSKCPKDCFEDRSYARWAAYEIIGRLDEEAQRLPSHITGSWREPIPPVDIIAGFIDDMEGYVYDCCSEQHDRIFSIAKDVADVIILLFL